MADQRSVFVPVDLDTGGGTENVLMISSRGEASGGSLPIYSPPAALADNTSNPTVGGVQTFGMVWDGANWDRTPGTSGDGLLVNLGTNNDVTNGGTFVVQEDGAALTALQLIDNPVQVLGNDTYTEAASSGMVIGAVRNNTLAALAGTDNEIAPLQVDATGALYARIASSVALDVSAATVTVDTELLAAAALSDALANPTTAAVGSHLMGYDRVNDDWTRVAGVVDGEVVGALNAGFLQVGTDGTNYQVIATDSSGNLQVDVLSGGGSPAVPANLVNDTFTTASVAVATPTNIDTAEVGARTLAWIDVWSSVNWKGEIFIIDDGTPSARLGVTGGPAMVAVQYTPVHRTYIATTANAGLDAFRLTYTNLDDNLVADVHVVFHYEDA